MRAEIVDGRLTRDLRRTVLRPELDADAPLPGDDLTDAVHFAVLDDDGQPVSTCFLYPERCPWMATFTSPLHLRQMATRPEDRGSGAGTAVLEAVLEYARSVDADLVWCNAREPAVGFYARSGFRTHGGVFTDEVHTIPHVRMSRAFRGYWERC